MRRLFSLFLGLRGKLIFTYTLVTVLALLALEILLLSLVVMFSALTDSDKRAYFNDVVTNLYPEAGTYLQPGQLNYPGLQDWLEQTHASGYASIPAQDAFDSPAAPIVQADGMVVLSPEEEVLAQVPSRAPPLSKQPLSPQEKEIFTYTIEEGTNILHQVYLTPEGNYRMAVPVYQSDRYSSLVGVILLTVEPPPPMFLQVWPTLLGTVLITGIFLLMAVVPFGALFGFIMSLGLTRRLRALTNAVDAWSEGDFRPLTTDKSKDEIGYLNMRMRNMAERVQNLLQTQQQLAMLEERNRLARELHDTVKQQTFATLMQVRAARNLLARDPEAAETYLVEAEKLIKHTQQELGVIIAELRPAALDGQGLATALKELLENWTQHSRIPADLNVLNERTLPLVIEQTLYRVAQEALSNVARHSHASAVTVRLAYEPNLVRLSIADNGVGFEPTDASRSGYGLQSMRERLAAVRGQLVVESTSEQGTTLTVTVPAF